MSDKGREILELAKECLTIDEIHDICKTLELDLETIIADGINRLIKKGDAVWLAAYRSLYDELKCLKKQRLLNASTNAQDLQDTSPDT